MELKPIRTEAEYVRADATLTSSTDRTLTRC